MSRESKLLDELVSRTRRMETRLTAYLVAHGADVYASQPVFEEGVLRIPSPDCSIVRCIAAVPKGTKGTIAVYHGTTLLGHLMFP